MNTSLLSILIFVSYTLVSGCGTQELRKQDYDEIKQGKKALLVTNNPDSSNFVDLLLANERFTIAIISVDGTNVSPDLLIINQKILIEPGKHTITAHCHITYRNNKESDEFKLAIGRFTVEFTGGETYLASVSEINSDNECVFYIR